MDLGLSGKRAIITGSTKGIGRAIAETLLDEGGAVAICARDADGVAAAVKELSERGTVWGSAVDAANADSLRGFVADAIAALGGLDIYVHNTSGKPAKSLEAWQNNFDIDLMALVVGADAAAEALAADGGGSLISIGTSAVGEHFASGANSYSVFKAAVTNWTLGQAQVLGAKGIRCNVVSPGPIWVEGGDWNRVKDARPEFFEATEKTHPVGHIGDVTDVANAVVFLASPAAKHINGANLTVDGGFMKRVNFLNTVVDASTPIHGRRMDVVLVAGGLYHDIDFARLELLKLLAEHEEFRVRVQPDYEDADAIAAAEILVSYTCDVRPSDRAQKTIRDWVADGGRWVALHGTSCALEQSPDGWVAQTSMPVWIDTLGSQFIAHPPIAPYRIENVAPDHWLVAGIETFEATDELYLNDYPDRAALVPLLQTSYRGNARGFARSDWNETEAEHLVMYLRPLGRGAVLYNTLGHCRGHYDMVPVKDYYPNVDRCSWDVPEFVELLRRSLRWARGGDA